MSHSDSPSSYDEGIFLGPDYRRFGKSADQNNLLELAGIFRSYIMLVERRQYRAIYTGSEIHTLIQTLDTLIEIIQHG